MVSSICPYLGKSNLTYIFPNGLKLATRWPFVSQLELRSSNVFFFCASGCRGLRDCRNMKNYVVVENLKRSPRGTKVTRSCTKMAFFLRSYPKMIQEIYSNVGNCPTARPSGKRSNSSRLFFVMFLFEDFLDVFPLPCFKFLVGENL